MPAYEDPPVLPGGSFFARCEPRGRADRVVRPYKLLCKSPGECVTRCHLHRRRFASVFAWQLASLGDLLPYRRRVVRCGKVTFVCWPERLILVLAVVLRQECTPRLQRLFSPHSFLARQKRMGRRRHVCGVTASYRMPVHADNPSVKTCGFATSPCTGEALGRTESSAPTRWADSVVRPYTNSNKCPEAKPQGICHIVCSGKMGCSSVRYRTRQ